jgi:hypothetical protein
VAEVSHEYVLDARRAMMTAYVDGVRPQADDPYAVLCAFLYCFIYCSDTSVLASEPLWCSQYREALAADVSTSVLDWTDEEVSLLRGSHLHTRAIDLRRIGDATVATVDGWLAHEGTNHGTGSERRMALKRCLSLLLTRAVRLHGDCIALVPGLDFFNCSTSSKTFIEGTRSGGATIVNRDGFYGRGQQAFISYGQKTSGELLLSYGFYPPENPHDGVLVTLDEPNTTLVLGLDGGVRETGVSETGVSETGVSETGVSETGQNAPSAARDMDTKKLRRQLKDRIRAQLSSYERRDEGRPWESRTVTERQIIALTDYERKVLSKALFSL